MEKGDLKICHKYIGILGGHTCASPLFLEVASLRGHLVSSGIVPWGSLVRSL